MADVRLDFYDLDADALPDLCMCCGAPAVVRPIKSFRWMPYWARFMPFGVGLAFIKFRRVPIPLCERHKRHWTLRYLVTFGGLAIFLVPLLCGAVLFAANVDRDPHGPLTIFGGLLLALAGLAFIAWLTAAVILSLTQIAPVEITDDTITLKNVHQDFARAYREQTRAGFAPDVEEVVREQWGKRPPERGAPRKPRRDDYPPDDKYRRR